LGVSFD
jgi:hypothetical protein